MITLSMKTHHWSGPLKLTVTVLVAFASIALPAAPSRGQTDAPTFLPLIVKSLPPPTIEAPEWAFTNDCAKAPRDWEGTAPGVGATIGPVAKKLAFVTFVRNAAGKEYSLDWRYNSLPIPGVDADTGIVAADEIIGSSILTFGPNGQCQSPQEPGFYEMIVLIDGQQLYRANLIIK